jgi:hypothetical protein
MVLVALLDLLLIYYRIINVDISVFTFILYTSKVQRVQRTTVELRNLLGIKTSVFPVVS